MRAATAHPIRKVKSKNSGRRKVAKVPGVGEGEREGGGRGRREMVPG